MKKLFKKKYKRNIGIFGGTFDPPHEGHLHIATVGIKKLKLDNLMWIVTKKNPLKEKSFLSVNSRIKLSKVITKKEKKIFVKYYDNKVKSTNTFNVLNFIKARNGNAKLFFLIGADNLAKFHKWHNWEKIPRLAKITVFPRKSYSFKSLKPITYKKLNKNDFIYIKSKKINISSSLIRKFW